MAALLAGLLTLALAGPVVTALAQDRTGERTGERTTPALPLEERPPPRPGPITLIRPETDEARPALRGSAAGSSRRRAATRRTRPPAQAPVRAVIRGPILAPSVAPEVQPPQTGLPDPATPIETPRRRRPVLTSDPALEDPYAPLGLKSGGVIVYPSIEQSFGYDSNPNRLSGKVKGSAVSRTEGEVKLRSDWPVHELTGALRGAYSAYTDVPGADRPEVDGKLNLRLDASRDTAFDFETRVKVDTQRPGSPDLSADVRDRPLVTTTGGTAGVTQRFNRFALTLSGLVDRTVYEDARLTNGLKIDQSDRDQTQYAVRLRGAYEFTPGLIPFIEVQADTREYDRTVDLAGFRRSSDGASVKAGTTFEVTRTLTGEVSAGVINRRYEDRRLRDLRGPLVDAAVIWSATPLTTVRLRATTSADETSVPGSSGILVQRGTAEIEHALRRNLIVTGTLSVAEADYRGVRLIEDTMTVGAALEYRLTRSVALKASYTHERLKSTSPGDDYTANVVLFGLKFQP